MIELYHNGMSVTSQKVRFALAEKGLEWRSHTLNLRAGDQQKPEYVRLNPNALVPTLVHDGRVVIESTLINEYIDDAFPEPPLKPADPYARWRMRMWTRALDDSIHFAMGSLTYPIAYSHEYAGKPREEIEAYLAAIPDPARRARNRENILKGLGSSYFADAVRRYHRMLVDIDRALRGGPWLAGDTFSLADIGYAPYVTKLDQLAFRPWFDGIGPRVGDWYDRIRKRAGYEAAIAKWVNPTVAALLREKGGEAWPRVKEIIAG
jgi:glutathione S-transferase